MKFPVFSLKITFKYLKMVRGTRNPLVQVVKRTSEIEHTKAAENYSTNTLKDISSHSKDRCFILKSGDFAFVKCDITK